MSATSDLRIPESVETSVETKRLDAKASPSISYSSAQSASRRWQLITGCTLFVILLVAGYAMQAIVKGVPQLLIPGSERQPLLLYGLGSTVIATLIFLPQWVPAMRTARIDLTSPINAAAAAGAAIILALVAGMRAYERTIIEQTADIKALWLFAVAIVIGIGLAQRRPVATPSTVGKRGVRTRIPYVLITVSIVAVVLVSRLVWLDRFPSASLQDEWTFSIYGRAARNNLLPNPFRTHDVNVQSDVWTWVDGLVSRPFPDSPMAYRILGVIVGSLAILTTALLARRTFGTPTAIAGAFIAATMPAQLWASRSSMANVLDPLVLTTALWLTDRVLETRDRRDAIACGILLGIGYYGYFGARAFPAVVAICMVGLAFKHPFRQSLLDFVRLGLWTLIGFGVTASPMIAYAASNPDEFFLRVRHVASSLDAPTIWDRVRLVIDGLSYPLMRPHGLFIHSTVTPVNMLGSVASIFFGIGVASWAVTVVIKRLRPQSKLATTRPESLLIAWVALTIPISQTYSMESHRFLAITPIWCLAVASGVLLVAGGISRLMNIQRVKTLATATIVLAICMQSLFYYFGEDRQYDMWGDPESTKLYDLGWRFHTAPMDTRIFAVGWEDTKFTWSAAIEFWSPTRGSHATYIETFSEDVPPFGPPTLAPTQVMILGPAHQAEVCTVLRVNRGAIVGTAYDRYGGILYTAITVDPAFPFRMGESPAESTFTIDSSPSCPSASKH